MYTVSTAMLLIQSTSLLIQYIVYLYISDVAQWNLVARLAITCILSDDWTDILVMETGR